MTRLAMILLWLSGVTLGVVVCGACSPAANQRAHDLAPVIEKGTCLVLRAASPDADAVCATADELTPYLDDLLTQLLVQRAVEGPPPKVQVAVALSPPTRKREPAKRHCVAWVPVTPLIDGGIVTAPDGGQDSGR